MPDPILRPREGRLWIAAFVAVAVLIVLGGFTSDDPDSALYAGLSERLSREPVGRWVAPEWWGFWAETGLSGYFLEHPAGIFWLPAALARLGVPGEQAAYVVGAGAGLLSLLLMGALVTRLVPRADARAVLVLLQLMPVAFIFRVRSNHEYPMLVCLLLTLNGLDGVKRSWRWLPLVFVGITGGLLIKGVFVSLILLAAVLWVLADPTRTTGGASRQWLACAVALLGAVLVGVAYDWLYVRATGGTFWTAYLARQIGPLTIASPLEDAVAMGRQTIFYVIRLLWHPAPWSLLLAWLMVTRAGAIRRLPRIERRTLALAGTFVVMTVAVLTLPSRYAERYAFFATFVVATIGAVAAVRYWPTLGETIRRADERLPALPALLWLGLVIGRLVLGPWLPRV